MSTDWLYFKFYGGNCNKALTTVLLNTLKLKDGCRYDYVLQREMAK